MQAGPPQIVAIIFTAILLGLPLAGLGWLIFKRCRFSIGQLLFSLFVYGAWLGLVNQDRARACHSQIVSGSRLTEWTRAETLSAEGGKFSVVKSSCIVFDFGFFSARG